MPKRPNPRAVKAVRTYTLPEAAVALGVSIGTVRVWVRKGLPAMVGQRPYLILGDHLRSFLEAKATKGMLRLTEDQLYCLTCKAPRRPMGMMLDFVPNGLTTGRLCGLCDTCGGVCNRMASRERLVHLATIFDIAYREGNRP